AILLLREQVEERMHTNDELARAEERRARKRWRPGILAKISDPSALCALCLASTGAREPFATSTRAQQDQHAAAPTLEETRLVMGKWIETKQIISKERNEWQQAKEILAGRLEVVKREIAGLEEKIQQAQTSVAETGAKKDEVLTRNGELETVGAQLTSSVT